MMQENFPPAALSSYDQSHSSYKSMEEILVSDAELAPRDALSNSISIARRNDPSLDDTRRLDFATTALNVDEQDKISSTRDRVEAGNSVNAATGSNSDFNKLHKQDQVILQNNMQQQQTFNPNLQPISYGSLNQFHHASSSVSIPEIQPNPPLFAMATGFMTPASPFYPNLQPPGLFSPQYSMGGYTFNPAFYPSYLPGFPYQGVVPLAFGGASFPGVLNGGNLHAYSLVGDMYGAYGHFGHQAPGDGAVLNQEDSRDLRKRTNVSLPNNHKSQHSAHASYNGSNIQRGTISSHYSFGRPTNIGPLEQFRTDKPVGGTNFSGERYNNPRKTYAHQSQSWNDTIPFSFLEELKSDKGQRFELSDIAGHICEFRQVLVALCLFLSLTFLLA